ncbi:MAG TPA: FAD-dependent oxidoreductase [Chitinophagales bacterium]|nr:FAD-dependent oxidoreductase [Chitinophagales bacterium]
MLAFPYYVRIFYPDTKANVIVIDSSNISQANFDILGMTCTACEEHVKHAVSQLPGFIEASADYKTGKASVKFDQSKTTLVQVTKAINETGYKVTHHELGRAEFIDEKTIIVGGKDEYTALKLIIATGSTTSIPAIKGLIETCYLTNDTLFDLEQLPESLTIIGGGYIGLEIAQAYQRFGSKVRIVEYFDRVLNSQTADIADEITKYLSSEGIEIHTDVKAEKVYSQKGKVILEGTQNGSKVIFESTHILIAAGRKPNTQNLGLEKINVQTLKSGHIIVNEFLETNVKNIYAIGDCNPNPPFVYAAAYEGKLAVQNAFAGAQKKTDYTAMPWVIFTDPQVAGVGMEEEEARKNNLPFEVSTIPLSEVPRSQAALDTRGFIKLIRNPETDKLLGARIVAPEGGELIMEICLAIKYGITVSELASAFHPYLTLSEAIKLAAIGFGKDVSKLSCCAA